MPEKKPAEILAWGTAIGISLAGAGFLLKEVIPSVGAAIGIGFDIAKTGTTTGISSWVIPAAGAGIAATGAVTSVMITHKIIVKIQKDLFDWLVPILSVISALTVDICKEFYLTKGSVNRLLFGALVSMAFILGSVLWRKGGGIYKFAGSLLFLFPPLYIYIDYIVSKNLTFGEGLRSIPVEMYIGILFVIGFAVFVAFVARDQEKIRSAPGTNR